MKLILLCATLALAACQAAPAAERGKRALAYYGCGSCHLIPGVAWARGRVGPPLAGIATRSYIAGRLKNEPAALLGFIRYPQALSPGSAMPNLSVGERDARDMLAYLYTTH